MNRLPWQSLMTFRMNEVFPHLTKRDFDRIDVNSRVSTFELTLQEASRLYAWFRDLDYHVDHDIHGFVICLSDSDSRGLNASYVHEDGVVRVILNWIGLYSEVQP